MEIAKEKYHPNPREKANFISVLFFGYTFKLFKKGYSKDIDVDDLYNPLRKDRSTILGHKLQRSWTNQLNQAKQTNTEPSLFRALMSCFWLDFLHTGCLIFMHKFVVKLLQPQLLRMLLNYFNPSSMTTEKEALIYGAFLVGTNIVDLFCTHQYILETTHSGMRTRTACCALVYRKVLKLSKTALGDTSSGKIVNLLSNDVNRFDPACMNGHQIWVSPLTTIFVIGILYNEAGYAGVTGILSMMILMLGQVYFGKLSGKFRKQAASRTDERIRLIDEVISGIQVIKMYAWEKPFKRIIELARKAEIRVITKASFVRSTFMVSTLFTSRVALFCTLLTLVFTHEQITASKVFVVLCYFNVLSSSAVTSFLRGISEIAEFKVALNRIQTFLLSEERKFTNVNENEKNMVDVKELISFHNLTAKWNLNYKENALENINLNILKGYLVGIIGPVGSGKSSMLQTILGELETVKGKISISGKISYASQEPWVFAATIRQNIIFGQEYEKNRYQEVIKNCALEADFKQFANGDLTLVGDRGASLSGGQKARINLARAVYRDADIYLLDDPLSAVDVHVAKHIYEECIKGYLENKTRILVTHQVHYVKKADHIVIMNNGRIEDQGTIKVLSKSDNNYAQLLTNSENVQQHFKNDKNVIKFTQLEQNKDDKMCDDTNETSKLLNDNFEYSEEQTLEKYENDKSVPQWMGSMTSIISEISIAKEQTEDSEQEIQVKDLQEASSKGKVLDNLLFKYITAGSNTAAGIFLLTLFIGGQIAASGIDYWVCYWTNIEEYRKRNISETFQSPITLGAPILDISTENCLYILGIGIVFLLLTTLGRTLYFYKLTMSSSKKLHATIYDSVTGTNMRFFDTNSTGRILNRFTKDMGAIDEYLPTVVFESSQFLLVMVGTLLLIVVVNPFFLILIAILAILFNYISRLYLKSSKDIKRLEGIMRSPVFTHIKATIEGLTTIRVFGAEQILSSEFDNHQDYHSSAWYMFLMTSGAFGFYIEGICSTLISLLTFSLLIYGKSLGLRSGEVGLAISQAASLAGYLQYGVKQATDVANQLMSVERILEYQGLPKEIQIDSPQKPDKEWPQNGRIVFRDLSLRYFLEGPLILKCLNLTIEPKEKVGVVGRTGAGKSSLIQALFRLAPLEGSIEIDGVDTKLISLENLRLKISIIPQDPVLFSGSLRYNLDPFGEYTDDVLYKAIRDVELKDPANNLNQLDYKVMDKGANYSVGQRQLICLARAIIRQNKVLVLDEATANVDPQTDALIQKTIREKFLNCTVITVAHRLNTIMDSDKVLVIDSGQIAEFSHPHLLLQNSNGDFYKMVMQTGKDTSNKLRKIASDSYERSDLVNTF